MQLMCVCVKYVKSICEWKQRMLSPHKFTECGNCEFWVTQILWNWIRAANAIQFPSAECMYFANPYADDKTHPNVSADNIFHFTYLFIGWNAIQLYHGWFVYFRNVYACTIYTIPSVLVSVAFGFTVDNIVNAHNNVQRILRSNWWRVR